MRWFPARPRPGAVWLFALLLLPMTAAGQGSDGASPAATPAGATDAYLDVLPALRAETMAETAGTINQYQIDVALDAEARTLSGTLAATFINTTSGVLPEIYFRLYPNAAYYGEGALRIDSARVAGQVVTTALEVEETALRVELPRPIEPGVSVTIDLAFATVVPVNSKGSFGIFSYDRGDGTWILADWHPVLAVYEGVRGWRVDPPTSFGDPTFATTALYDVRLAVPETLTVVTSGLQVSEAPRGEQVSRRYTAGPAREFTLVIDDDYQAVRSEANGTTVTVYSQPAAAGSETAVAREQTLAVAVDALALYSERFGPYPFAALDLVETDLIDAFAVSWSGIIFLDGSTLLGEYAVSSPVSSSTVVAHEVAHLWWGATIGSNSNDHTFINEGLATVSSMVYQEAFGDPEDLAVEFDAWIAAPSELLLDEGDAVVDLPLAEGQDQAVRSWAYYGKAALGFTALRQEIGDDAFFAGLLTYAETYQYRIAEPDDLQAAFEAAARRDLDAFWTSWFEATDLTDQQIDAVADATR